MMRNAFCFGLSVVHCLSNSCDAYAYLFPLHDVARSMSIFEPRNHVMKM